MYLQSEGRFMNARVNEEKLKPKKKIKKEEII